MTDTKVLITGATGYIGGSLLTSILKSANPVVKKSNVSAVVRREDQAKVLRDLGVNPIIIKDQEDSDDLNRAASEHDVVVHTANGFHPPSAEALISGLAARKQKTGKEVHLIHTAGTSNLSDMPVTSAYKETRVFSDKENIYQYEKYRQEIGAYPGRSTDISVVENGLAAGVKTYIVMLPTIYGQGTGLFNKFSIQIPMMMRSALKDRQASVIGKGTESWDHVHVADVVSLYEAILRKLLAGENIPSGEQGIYFGETGNHTWMELSEAIGKVGFDLGVLSSPTPKVITLEEAAQRWFPNVLLAELGFASRSRTSADLSREIGWQPQKTKKDFEANITDEWKIIAQKKQ